MLADSAHERIVTPAIRIDGGHIVEGKTEMDAVRRAVDAGLIGEDETWETDPDGRYRIEGGWLTSQGRIVHRADAIRIARDAGQLRRNSMWNYQSDVVPLRTKRYRGMFSEGHLKGLKGKSALAEPPKATAGEISGATVESEEPRIVSRAIKYTDVETWPVESDKLVTDIRNVEGFAHKSNTYRSWKTNKPLHVLEGYNLSDSSFITRDEAEVRFIGADIGPEGRGWAVAKTASTKGNL